MPFGRQKSPYFPKKELYYFFEKSKKATFICCSYELALNNPHYDSVVYCDPPYLPLSKTSNFTGYYINKFNIDEHKKLVSLIENIYKNRYIPVLVSNQNILLSRILYRKACLHFVQTQRSISCNSKNRKKIDELLALYY